MRGSVVRWRGLAVDGRLLDDVRRPLTVEPEQKGERRAQVAFDANPQLAMSYHIPAYGHRDGPALQMLGSLLSDGRTSRLYTAITQKGLGTANADGGTGRYPNVFGISAVPRQPRRR